MADENINYTSDNIKTLEWNEHIRKRAGMYIGRLGNGDNPGDGIYVLLKEVIDNSIDEFTMGYGKTINITIDSTEIARLDLTGKLYLANVSAKNTAIEFLDMHDQIGYNGLKRLDLRYNNRMTPQTLNFTFAAMPPHMSESRWTKVYIDGTLTMEFEYTE